MGECVGGFRGALALPLSFSRTQKYCFTQGCYPRLENTIPLTTPSAPGENCVQQLYRCAATLMNNKIIIPIHAVIKWDWLYLPVCSHWARSSIIIQSVGVWLCKRVRVPDSVCVWWGVWRATVGLVKISRAGEKRMTQTSWSIIVPFTHG